MAESTFTFDVADRLTGLTHKKGAATLATYTWTVDKANRITKLVSTDGTVDYTYDNRDQLTFENYTYQPDKTHRCTCGNRA